MTHVRLSELQLQILEKLARYKYLTASQLHQLGTARRLNSVREGVRKLAAPKRRALIGRLSFPVVPGVGRLANVAYLKPTGVSFLVEYLGHDPEKIRYPKQHNPFFSRDYFHRLAIVDFQIGLDQYADAHRFEVERFEADFDYVGSNRTGTVRRESKTKIWLDATRNDFLIPDAAFILSLGGDKPVFGLLEVHRGRDSKRSVGQLLTHARAMEDGAPTEKYNLMVGNRVFCLYEHMSIRNVVAERVRTDERFAGFRDRFCFATLEEMSADWGRAWKVLEGKSVLP